MSYTTLKCTYHIFYENNNGHNKTYSGIENGIKHGIYRVYTKTINIKYFRFILLHLNNRNLLCVCPTD